MDERKQVFLVFNVDSDGALFVSVLDPSCVCSVVVLVVFVGACSNSSVGHVPLKPWISVLSKLMYSGHM